MQDSECQPSGGAACPEAFKGGKCPGCVKLQQSRSRRLETGQRALSQREQDLALMRYLAERNNRAMSGHLPPRLIDLRRDSLIEDTSATNVWSLDYLLAHGTPYHHAAEYRASCSPHQKYCPTVHTCTIPYRVPCVIAAQGMLRCMISVM